MDCATDRKLHEFTNADWALSHDWGQDQVCEWWDMGGDFISLL